MYHINFKDRVSFAVLEQYNLTKYSENYPQSFLFLLDIMEALQKLCTGGYVYTQKHITHAYEYI